MIRIILASSSRYRRQLLEKIGLDFSWQAPDIDESALPNESPRKLVMRLAQSKALALTNNYPKSLIIGSDQVAVLDHQILGKPLDHARATAQLSAASGQKVTFLTGLCLYNTSSGRKQLGCESYVATFRTLTPLQIENYLQREQPYDCSGSFKCEGMGISLFTKLQGEDPNTLIGLPLIALINMLNKEGIDVLG